MARDGVAVEVSERTPLSTRTKALLAIGALVSLALVVATASSLYARHMEAHRSKVTRDTLETARGFMRGVAFNNDVIYGQGVHFAVVRDYPDGEIRCVAPPDAPAWSMRDRAVCDSWGNPIRLESPGPVHRKGWDVWSCGPNGVDERGGGDDILIGEDMASCMRSAR